MANVIKTVLTYPLDGSTTDFNIPFEYLARKFVVVTLLGVDRRVLTLPTDYRFATRTVIATNKAWGPADGYTQIEIRRVTSATERLVDFTDGSILRAYDLNVAQIQTMHVAEEARNMTADTIGVNNDGHLDARGRRIVNLAYATSDHDAVPLKQIKEREFSAWNAVTKANEHADRSATEANSSRDEASRAQREADRSTQQAGVSTQQAVESKKQADRSSSEANRAKGYADSMTASVAEAKKQADRSGSEANRASDGANRAAGEVTKAAAEVAKAATHVETAKGHADRANIEANRSKGEADRAKSEADKLANLNDFSQTIAGVTQTDVTFNRGVISTNLTSYGLTLTNTSASSSYIVGRKSDGSQLGWNSWAENGEYNVYSDKTGHKWSFTRGTISLQTGSIAQEGDGLITGAVNGGEFVNWWQRPAGILVSCQDTQSSAHQVLKATHWGRAHLFGIDVHAPGGISELANTQVHFHLAGNTGSSQFRMHSNGEFYAAAHIDATDIMMRSDKRLKSNFEPIHYALDKIDALNVWKYDKKQSLKSDNGERREVGIIAQELREVLPEAVNSVTIDGDELLTVSHSGLIGLLIKAVQELRAEVNELKSKR